MDDRPGAAVPAVCILDPYGDIAGPLARAGRGKRHRGWACFHTEMWTAQVDGRDVGIVTGALGAAWAVLVAEELAASGCRVVVSISPALPVDPPGPLPCVVLIDRALRDEAVSSRHPSTGRWSRLDATVAAGLAGAFDGLPIRVRTAAARSTAAPCRVPAVALTRAATNRDRVSCVDTDAAALYAFASGWGGVIVCLAHLDTATVTSGAEVTWGAGVGAETLLAVGAATATALRTSR